MMDIRLRAAVFFTQNNKVLFTHHNFSDNDYWVLPGATVQPGESVYHAAVRATKEEIDIDTMDLRFLFTREHFHGNTHLMEFYFLGALGSQIPQPNASTILDTQFLSPEDLQHRTVYPVYIKDQLASFLKSNFSNISPFHGLVE